MDRDGVMNSTDRSDVTTELQNFSIESFTSQALTQAEQNATGQAVAVFGPVALGIKTCGSTLSSVALDPLRHAMVKHAVPVDFRLVMIDGKATGINAASLSGDFRNPDGGRPAATCARASTLTLNDQWQTRCLIDAHQQRGLVWFADAASLPEWVIYDQIRNALHWVSHAYDLGLFHAAALRLGDIGCLITGKSGSGKSTITAAAVARGFETAGDDFVLVETTKAPHVHAIFDTIKLDDRSLARFSEFQPFMRNPVRRPDEKAIIHLFDAAPKHIASGFRLNVILHAHLTGQRHSRIATSSPSEAFRALAPSSLLLLRVDGNRVAANCAALVSQLAAYSFEIGTDVDGAVAELASFMRGLQK